jgi:hypothetical protein
VTGKKETTSHGEKWITMFETRQRTENPLPNHGKVTQHVLSVMKNVWSIEWLTAHFMPYSTANFSLKCMEFITKYNLTQKLSKQSFQ